MNLQNRKLASERVFFWFEQLCSIPHGSGNTKAISNFCVAFAQQNGLEYEQDRWNNVIIRKPASPGYETVPAVILQGHLDMVCVKDQEKNINFKTDGLDLLLKDDFLMAEGTSLGADNGIGIALCLALLESDSAPLPALETIFTVDEETGMDGATHIVLDHLKGKRMINLDSGPEGIFTVGCAGGVRISCCFPVRRKKQCGIRAAVTVSGLTGGHSGIDIGKGGANAIVLLGELLTGLGSHISLLSLNGGEKTNVIPQNASAEFLTSDIETVKQIITDIASAWKHSFSKTDPQLNVFCSIIGEESADCLDNGCSEQIIKMLYLAPYGVQSSDNVTGTVISSLNLGVLTASSAEINVLFGVRSSLDSEWNDIADRIVSLTKQLGGTANKEGAYPAWERRENSQLCRTMTDVYQKLYGTEPVVTTIHAGLECGILTGKIADLDCVSIGPDLFGCHTTSERLSVSSVERTWKFLLEVLKTTS